MTKNKNIYIPEEVMQCLITTPFMMMDVLYIYIFEIHIRRYLTISILFPIKKTMALSSN